MTKISPVNSHLLIEPIKHDGFIATQQESYQEIGVVVAIGKGMIYGSLEGFPKVGDKVYFDSWLAKRYPKEGGKSDEYFWLVKWEDVVAVEYVESVSE